MEKSLKIICAEDNPGNRATISAQLKRLGYEALVVEDGFALLEALEKNGFNLVLMDVRMPALSGLEATRKIRRGECGKEKKAIFIIGITAYALLGDKEKCLEAGMNDYLPKPVTVGVLREALERAVESIF